MFLRPPCRRKLDWRRSLARPEAAGVSRFRRRRRRCLRRSSCRLRWWCRRRRESPGRGWESPVPGSDWPLSGARIRRRRRGGWRRGLRLGLAGRGAQRRHGIDGLKIRHRRLLRRQRHGLQGRRGGRRRRRVFARLAQHERKGEGGNERSKGQRQGAPIDGRHRFLAVFWTAIVLLGGPPVDLSVHLLPEARHVLPEPPGVAQAGLQALRRVVDDGLDPAADLGDVARRSGDDHRVAQLVLDRLGRVEPLIVSLNGPPTARRTSGSACGDLRGRPGAGRPWRSPTSACGRPRAARRPGRRSAAGARTRRGGPFRQRADDARAVPALLRQLVGALDVMDARLHGERRAGERALGFAAPLPLRTAFSSLSLLTFFKAAAAGSRSSSPARPEALARDLDERPVVVLAVRALPVVDDEADDVAEAQLGTTGRICLRALLRTTCIGGGPLVQLACRAIQGCRWGCV